MSDWERSTKKLLIEHLPPEYKQAIQEHIDFFNLKGVFEQYLICIETKSVKKKKKLFGGGLASEMDQFAILSPAWIVIAAQGSKPGTIGVLSVQTKDAHAVDYKDDPSYKLIQDSGVNVTGPYTGLVGLHTNISTYFIGLGPEPAAEQFKQCLLETIEKARD